jgi:DNA-binding transcriptional ArsR family regulator
MDLETAARILAELGNRTRLEILRLLVRAGPGGLPVGEIQAHLDIPASTLAFHLRGLVVAGIVAQEKQGRVVLCRPCFEVIDEVVGFLKSECCTGVGMPRSKRSRVA